MNPDKTAIEKPYYVKKDQEQAVFWLDAFIEAVNADHDDLILVPRDHGCLMRDEIERLRRVERAALSEAEGERETTVYELLTALKSVLELIEDGTLVRDVSQDADRSWMLKAARLVSRLGVAKQAVATAETLNPAPPKEKP